MAFGLFPHAGDWSAGGVPEAAERYRHPFVAAPGTGEAEGAWPPAGAGDVALALDAPDVTLTSLRRRSAGWLEARVVNLASASRRVTLRGSVVEARTASLRGEPGDPLEVVEGAITLALGPAEIRTVQLRRTESSLARAEVLDASGPRQSA
jgi:alpha-mannosidase